jgi:YihY family inner membrane protein
MNSELDSGHRFRVTLRAFRLLLSAVSRRFGEGRCSQVAASLAFTSLLSVVPFVTLVAVVFSKFPQSQRFADALRGFLLDNLLPEKAGKVIAAYAFQFSQKTTNLTIVGGAVLILTAIMLMRTIDQVINEIWRVQVHRPWATRLVAYWAVLSLGPLLLAGGVFAAGAMLSVSMDFMNEPAWLEVAGLRLVSLGVLAGVFATLYFAVPHCSVRAFRCGAGGVACCSRVPGHAAHVQPLPGSFSELHAGLWCVRCRPHLPAMALSVVDHHPAGGRCRCGSSGAQPAAATTAGVSRASVVRGFADAFRAGRGAVWW